MRNIAVVPARSGSKGLKDKNIRDMCGKPMLAYSIIAAYESGVFDTVMVSTDSDKYAEIGKRYGAEVPFLRSDAMSGDTVGSWDVVKEVLEKYRSIGKEYDTICLLQPTSPLRCASDIKGAYRFMEEKKGDSISSVCECEHQLQDMMTLTGDMSLLEYRQNDIERPRQLCPLYYRLNGAIFIRSISYEDKDIVLKCENEYAYVMPQDRSVDIDTALDFEIAEFIMSKQDV